VLNLFKKTLSSIIIISDLLEELVFTILCREYQIKKERKCQFGVDSNPFYVVSTSHLSHLTSHHNFSFFPFSFFLFHSTLFFSRNPEIFPEKFTPCPQRQIQNPTTIHIFSINVLLLHPLSTLFTFLTQFHFIHSNLIPFFSYPFRGKEEKKFLLFTHNRFCVQFRVL